MSTVFWILAILVLFYFFGRLILVMIAGIALAIWAMFLGILIAFVTAAGAIDKKLKGK